MGRSFFNLMVKGVEQQALARYLTERKIRTFVAPTQGAVTPVFPSYYDDGTLACELSRRFLCPVLFIHVYDDDILYYRLFIRGTLRDAYDSYPGYFSVAGQAQTPEPQGGNADTLCAAFDVPSSIESVETILRFPNWEPSDDSTKRYASAEDRCCALAMALAFPIEWNWDHSTASLANDVRDIETGT